jgi:uncharacterized protein YxjI
MGFGMKKDVYTWRPKKVFSSLKKYYKVEYQKGIYIKGKSLSHEQREEIKQRIRAEVKSQNIKIAIVTSLLFIVLIAVVAISISYLKQ